jgi:hypothetical protein
MAEFPQFFPYTVSPQSVLADVPPALPPPRFACEELCQYFAYFSTAICSVNKFAGGSFLLQISGQIVYVSLFAHVCTYIYCSVQVRRAQDEVLTLV